MTAQTIFIVMMENRSFDHLLGYLSLSGVAVDGLRDDDAWKASVANHYEGVPYPPFHLRDPYGAIEADPPHGRGAIKTQLGIWDGTRYPMKGFVESYAKRDRAPPGGPGSHPPAMSYFTSAEAPVMDFFAREFAVCDRWHASLPAGTQPNRLMAMSGFTRIDGNEVPMPAQELVYDWLDRMNVRWRVYHSTIPFFALMLERVPQILTDDRFRPLQRLYDDVRDEPPEVFPQVVFIEPAYSDAPHIGPSCDDHAPAGIKGGQGFLLECYRALTRVPILWNRSVMIVTYDEHGGFFDHVSPPRIRTDPPANALFADSFESLGVRVPALVISPFVQPGSICSQLMDHTSILKFIGETFGSGQGYSAVVDARPVASVSAALDNPGGGRRSPVIPSLIDYLAREPANAGRKPGTLPDSTLQDAFQRALDEIRLHPEGHAQYAPLLATFPPS